MEPTPVLLGCLDSPCPSPYLSVYENKIGGYPDCFPCCPLRPSVPPCCVCGEPLCLLVQVYCPLENSEYHRTIHIFCCVQPPCHGNSKSWLVLRSQYKGESCDTLTDETSTTPGLSATDWCQDADDWGRDNDSACGNVEKEMEQLTISEPTLTSTATNTETGHPPLVTTDPATLLTASGSGPHTTFSSPFFPPSYLTVTEEPAMSGSQEMLHAQSLLRQYQKEASDTEPKLLSKGAKSSGGEGYEKAAVKHGDRAFQKFHKQLEKCPQQLIRYHRGGDPLLISDSPPHLPPSPSLTPCKHCGAHSVFELQLMPTLVYCIQSQLPEQPKSHDTLGRGHMPELGTVLVYTCSNNCWTQLEQFREETCFIQNEHIKN